MTKTILLADDSVTIQKVVELTFMDEDFRVAAVSNGAEAIAHLGESKPDVVIADVHMPGADGYEVCRRSKELYPAVPVLLLVGTFESFDSDEAMRCGADGHLKKPFDSQELMRRVRELSIAPSGALAVPSAPAVIDAGSAALAADLGESELWQPIGDDLPLELSPVTGAEDIVYEDPAMELAPEPVARFAPTSPSPAPAATYSAAPSAPSAPFAEAGGAVGSAGLSDADVDRIARRMLELVGDKAVRDVAWEVVPDLAEVLLKSRIRELESSID